MAMAFRVYIILLIFLSISTSIFSLYEDQVGLMDWHKQYIGKVKHAVFHTQKAGRKRVLVSTEENVIASLDLRRGDIFWRHVLGAKDVVDQIDIALGKYVITLSSGGTVLRAWNLPDGQMVWETFLPGFSPPKTFLSVSDKGSEIFVYGSGCIHAVSSIDGDIIWQKELAAERIEVQRLIPPPESDVIYVFGFVGSSQFDAYQINAKDGHVLKHESESLMGEFPKELLSVTSNKLVALDSSRSALVSISIMEGEINFQQTLVSDLIPDSTRTAVILPAKINGLFALKVNTFVTFVEVTDEGTLNVVDKIDNVVAISDSLFFLEGQQAFGIVQQQGSKIHLTVKLGHDWSSILLKESIDFDQERGLVHKVFINNYIRMDRSNGFRALVVMEDHSLLLVQQGAIVWSREDGLASIIDVTTAELPVEKNGVSVSKVEHSLFEWLKGHLLKLKGTLMLATPDDIVAIQKIRLQSSEKSKMTRDHNGFRKLLLVLTTSGKLFALHTGDGRIIWSQLLHSLRKSESCEHPTARSVHQWQVPHHHTLKQNPSILVIGLCEPGVESSGVLSIVDSYTGKEISSLGPLHSIEQVIPLPFTDSTEQRLHLFVDANKQAHLYPTTYEAVDIFKRELANIYFYSVEANDGIIRGYEIKGNCVREVPDDYCFDTKVLWSIVFPSESEKIIATVTRKANEVVHTQAKVIADQDVLYKYISKNLLFVATVAPKASGEIGSVTPEESWLVVYLVDTVTGRILHRVTHHGCQGPLHAVFSENWVVYHYFNLRAHRYEMSVIEIYDQSRADNKDILKLLVGNHNLTAPISSYSRPEVMTKSQSYFFPHSVKTIAVTLTAKGITSKQLLVGTIGDQVLAMDKRFLDPRRSTNPTQAEKEEGLLPFSDSLPIIPQSYVTHALKVEKLRGINTIPAKLESTTLVFGYGVDLFFTHLAPSRTYDSLTEDFSYALLLITIFALLIAIFVTWVFSERKELQEKWK